VLIVSFFGGLAALQRERSFNDDGRTHELARRAGLDAARDAAVAMTVVLHGADPAPEEGQLVTIKLGR
jgi:hypothetical protein